MDTRNKVTSFEEILMIDPFNNRQSLKECKSQLEDYDFSELIYPRHFYTFDDSD